MIDDGAAADDELLRAVAPLSLRSSIDGPSVARPAGRSLSELGPLTDHTAVGLYEGPFAAPLGDGPGTGPGRRAVAASVACQAVAAQVASVALLAELVVGTGLDVDLTDVRWRADGWGTRLGLVRLRRRPSRSPAEAVGALVERFTAPWVAAVAGAEPVAERLLWGDAAAATWTALASVHAHRPLVAADLSAIEDVLTERVPWTDLVIVDRPATGPLSWHRSTCCLILHAGLPPCDECPLPADARR